MPIKKEREYRTMARPLEEKRTEGNEPSFLVEGYATTFNQPYLMFEDTDGTKYFESVDSRAFDEADLSDVIMQFDHSGMVYARNRNKSLQLETDEHGLKVTADLGLTEQSRQLYEAIRTGLVSDMSFAFVVSDDYFDKETRTRNITKIKKVYDVSAVSIPANPETTISARSYVDGVIEQEARELREAEAIKDEIRKLIIKTEVTKWS